ncbi:MAG TPA: LCP family protein [Clostridiales bacterium]|nr:LCP family protein [Clostridiales bacterium]
MKSKVIISVISICLILGGVAGYFVHQMSNPVKVFETESSDNYELKTARANVRQYDIDYGFMKGRVNILLLGLDLNEQRLKTMGAFRTDTIMLFSVDFVNKKIAVLSIPRDTYVLIPRVNTYDKINSAFAHGGGLNGAGFALTRETVTDFLGGIPINYHVGLGMDVVEEIIDAMGGLELAVDVPVKLGNRELKIGKQKLTGQQVMDYSRWRYTPKGDIDRVERQQRVIMAIFNQLLRLDQLKNIPQIYSLVKEKVYTDLDFTKIATLAFFAKDLTMDDIKTYKIDGDFLDIDGISYWGVYQRDKQRLIKEIFGVEIEVDMNDDVHYLKRRILMEQREEQRRQEEELRKKDEYMEKDKIQPEKEQPEDKPVGGEQPKDKQPQEEQPEEKKPEEKQPEEKQPVEEQPKDGQSEGKQPKNESSQGKQPKGQPQDGKQSDEG